MTNSFKSPKQKFCVAEKKLCVHVAQKVKCCLQKQAKVAEKVTLCRQKSSLWSTKKYFMSTKKSWCRTKKKFHAKKKNRFLLHRKMFPVQKSYYLPPERRAIHRNSHPDVFLRKSVMKICSKFTGEHPCRNVFSIKEHLCVAAS